MTLPKAIDVNTPFTTIFSGIPRGPFFSIFNNSRHTIHYVNFSIYQFWLPAWETGVSVAMTFTYVIQLRHSYISCHEDTCAGSIQYGVLR